MSMIMRWGGAGCGEEPVSRVGGNLWTWKAEARGSEEAPELWAEEMTNRLDTRQQVGTSCMKASRVHFVQ